MYSYFKLMLWACLWWWAWLFTFPLRKGRDNCLTWAQRKHDEEGGYLVIRWCKTNRTWLRWPHFAWLPAEDHDKIVHYVPYEDKAQAHRIPSLWFEGYVKYGDDDAGEEN